jgi:2'-5' RNA ligase
MSISLYLNLLENDLDKIDSIINQLEYTDRISKSSLHITLLRVGTKGKSYKKYLNKIIKNMKIDIELEFDKLDKFGFDKHSLVMSFKKNDKLNELYFTLCDILDKEPHNYIPHIKITKTSDIIPIIKIEPFTIKIDSIKII